jgi:hypothetical protein
MTQTFKLHIDAVSPDGIAVNCQSEISIQAERHTSVSILANLFNQEPKIKSLVAEALVLSLSGEKIAEPVDVDDFLDSMLKAKKKD